MFYAEHVLGEWDVAGTPWPFYHAAMVFERKRTNGSFAVDFIPVNTSRTLNLLRPHFRNDRYPSLIESARARDMADRRSRQAF